MIEKKNIYDSQPRSTEVEFFEDLISESGFRLERIISEGHASPENFWYDQNENEFVLLLQGSAEISFEDGQTIRMSDGDYIIIPKHTKHRVEKTAPSKKTFWLTLFF